MSRKFKGEVRSLPGACHKDDPTAAAAALPLIGSKHTTPPCPSLTGPQIAALGVLPKDGTWASPGSVYTAKCNSLALYHPDLCKSRRGMFGRRNGYRIEFRLTPAGVEEARRRGL
jgi:hypothetical protein